MKINETIRSLREKKPLIHCITNPISINQCANTILSVGAKPIMAEHPKEIKEITKNCDVLILNIGNITDARKKSIKISSKTAFENNIPFVLDMVGISCSSMRRKLVYKLLKKTPPNIIKGNYSEINALYDLSYKTRGVDADGNLNKLHITNAAKKLANKYHTTVLASGKTDIITDGKRTFYVNNGCSQLSDITGTGCMLAVLCGCFISVSESLSAAVTACVILGRCGELVQLNGANGSFNVKLIDCICNLKELKEEELKINEF